MAAIASIADAVWPGILGAVATGVLIYLSLLGFDAPPRAVVLEWPTELDEPTWKQAR